MNETHLYKHQNLLSNGRETRFAPCPDFEKSTVCLMYYIRQIFFLVQLTHEFSLVLCSHNK